MYLVGHAAFRLRLVGDVAYQKLVAATALMAVFALGGGLRAWIVALSVAVIVGALCVRETLVERSESVAASDLVSESTEADVPIALEP
jgi:hypothetical protein